jgi:hypothetical protein
LVTLFSWGSEFGLTRASAIQLALDVFFTQRQSSRDSIDDDAYCLSVALAESGNSEYFAKSIARYLNHLDLRA